MSNQTASLKAQIDSRLRGDVIMPAELYWASPLVPVAKKDSRWAKDYRELNKFTVLNVIPTPNILQLIERLAGSEIFSSLDASPAFHNVQINEDSQ